MSIQRYVDCKRGYKSLVVLANIDIKDQVVAKEGGQNMITLRRFHCNV